jgi:serine/threonine-protein kinase
MSPPSSDPAADEVAFAILDAYVAQLQTGQRPDPQTVRAAHPQLANVLQCLDALENLAPAKPTTTDPAAPPADDAPTMAASPDKAEDATSVTGEFGKFELVQELGRGGMGVVYKARQKDLGRLVALKMILAGQLASEEVIGRFHDEARAAALVQHPHITAVYEAGQLHGQPYIAMQFVAGPSLAQRLHQGPLPPPVAVRIVAAVARAVHHLHSKGIIHRDLKPSNILLDEQGQPYVTDFGLVKLLAGDSHKTSTGVILGTPSYMAPEQAAGRAAEVGAASDVYSLGAILYECLTGRPPFREATPLDTLVQVLEGEPPHPRTLNPKMPQPLVAICLRCLEKSPQRRYATAAMVADNLERFLNGEEVEGPAPGLWPRLARWARREPALVSRLGALAVCFALIQVNYHVAGNVNLSIHVLVVVLMFLWGLAAWVFQKVLNSGRWEEDLPFVWAAADMLLWTVLLIVGADAPETPLLAMYPCLVAASGLWFRVRMVWFTTILSLLSYAVFLWVSVAQGQTITAPHRHFICAVALLVAGCVVAYQVNRVRALSRYYDRRPLGR